MYAFVLSLCCGPALRKDVPLYIYHKPRDPSPKICTDSWTFSDIQFPPVEFPRPVLNPQPQLPRLKRDPKPHLKPPIQPSHITQPNPQMLQPPRSLQPITIHPSLRHTRKLAFPRNATDETEVVARQRVAVEKRGRDGGQRDEERVEDEECDPGPGADVYMLEGGDVCRDGESGALVLDCGC